MEVTEFVLFLVLLLLIYTLPGLLVLIRKNRKQISSRSPLLLLVSHLGNTCQSVALLIEITPNVMDPDYGDFLESSLVFFHYLFYLPYLLRGYRLYFVFHTEIGKSEQEDAYFLTHIRRSKQWWLFCVLMILMSPVILLCIALILVPRLTSQEKFHTNTPLYERVYILIAFSEQMLFIVVIYLLRHVDRYFSMNRELLLVCFMWYFNVLFSGHATFTFWMYELLARNTLIMCVSVLVPLVRSYSRPEMKESLTLQSMYSLQLVLENRLPHEYFEEFLKAPQYRFSSDPLHGEELESAGSEVLQLYCLCSIYKSNVSLPVAEQLITELREFRNEFSLLPEGVLNQVLNDIQQNEMDEELFKPVEQFLFALLEDHYFPLFKKSNLFGMLCRFVEQSELREGRIKTTSLVGEESV